MTPAPPPARGPHRSRAAFATCVLALAALTALDLGTKAWAVQQLSSAPLTPAGEVCRPDNQGHIFMQRVPKPPIVLVPDYLQLRYAENCGAAFGLFDRTPGWLRLALLAPAALAATLGLLWLFAIGYGARLFALSVPLITSGALGNLIDRLRFGYVVDFVRFHVRDAFAWPTFNLADITIALGVLLLLLEGWKPPHEPPAQTKPPER